ncbi:MAG: mechanosensitive ion channel family protein [Bacteroidales bacterium]
MENFLEHLRGIINLKLIDTTNITISVYNILIIFLILLVTIFALRGVKRIFKGLASRNVFDQGDVGVKYRSYLELVTRVLLDCAKDYPRIISLPAPFVRFVDFGESSFDFQLFFWTNDTFYVENIKSDLRYKIDKAFRENKIEIPFSQRDLYLKSTPPKK